MTDIHTHGSAEYEAPIEFLPAFISALRYWWLILLSGVIFAAGAYIGVRLFAAPLYTSEFTIHVSNYVRGSEQKNTVSTADMSAARDLASTYAEIINGRSVFERAAAQADLSFSYEDLCDIITVSPVQNTGMISVSVVTTDPVTSLLLAQSIADVTVTHVSGIVEGSSMQIIDGPEIASSPSSPHVLKYTVVGAALGIIVAVCVLLTFYILDINVNVDTLNLRFGFPVFGCIPADSFSEENTESVQAIQEAYRTLRANIAFSLDGPEAKCIAVTCDDGLSDKSSVSINLAITFAQTDKRVLLIDCDMQQRTLTKMLDMGTRPGLSDFLTGRASLPDIVYSDIANVDVLPAGRVSNVPKMLLESSGIDLLIQRAREKYDCIFLDLASAASAADAAVMAHCSDGFLLVLRQNRTKNKVVGEMIHRLELAGGKILGFVICGVR